MATATIRFKECIQDSQDYGSDDEHMVSRVFLDLESDGQVFPNLTVDIKQTVGSSFEDGPLEVAQPRGYDGSMNYAPFRNEVEKYYRGLVGKSGVAIRIGPGVSGLRMRNNRMPIAGSASFDFTESSAAW
jgi:hypothetical protein